MNDIAQAWDQVQERIAAACARSARNPEDVALLAVSKKHPPAAIDEAARCGCRLFGESRVQEAMEKMDACTGGISWHFIGHLQRNKVRPVVARFDRIHSVDSLRLLERIESCAAEEGRQVAVCLEVNVSGESSKYGFAPEEVPAVLAYAPELRYAIVDGVMTMAPFTEDPADARPHFRRLRECRDAWVAQTGWALDVLSMGMSRDFEIAIEEGATMVRVGTALFGTRPKPKGEGAA